jgi:hypothetical protein
MVFKHLWYLFNLKDLANGFFQSFMMCFYVVARCIFKNIIGALGTTRLLALTKPFAEIWSITIGQVFYQLVNKTFYLSFHDAFIFHLSPPPIWGCSHGRLWSRGCRNPNLKFATKAKAYKGAGQKWSSRITSYAPRSVGKCEGLNLHTPKLAPTLGVKVSMDSQIFREQLHGSKPIRSKISLYHWKIIGT